MSEYKTLYVYDRYHSGYLGSLQVGESYFISVNDQVTEIIPPEQQDEHVIIFNPITQEWLQLYCKAYACDSNGFIMAQLSNPLTPAARQSYPSVIDGPLPSGIYQMPRWTGSGWVNTDYPNTEIKIPYWNPNELTWTEYPFGEDEARQYRNRLLDSTDWLVTRHIEQLALQTSTDLTEEQYESWLQYRQDLRDISFQEGFPGAINWPTPPEP